MNKDRIKEIEDSILKLQQELKSLKELKITQEDLDNFYDNCHALNDIAVDDFVVVTCHDCDGAGTLTIRREDEYGTLQAYDNHRCYLCNGLGKLAVHEQINSIMDKFETIIQKIYAINANITSDIRKNSKFALIRKKYKK